MWVCAACIVPETRLVEPQLGFCKLVASRACCAVTAVVHHGRQPSRSSLAFCSLSTRNDGCCQGPLAYECQVCMDVRLALHLRSYSSASKLYLPSYSVAWSTRTAVRCMAPVPAWHSL
jgi:hypothetical protein